MKIKHMLVWLLLGSGFNYSAWAQNSEPRPLTVDETIRLVVQNNSTLRQAIDAITVIEAKVEQSRSYLSPTVHAEMSYARIGPTSEFAIPDLGSFQLFPADNYDAHIGARYVLYDFHRTARTIDLARTQIDSAVDRRELLKRDLEYQTAQLFYAILFLQDNCRIQNEHIQMLNEHLEVAKRKFTSGTATELEVLSTQTRVITAQNQQLELENMLAKQMITLRRLLGSEEQTPLQLDGELAYKAVSQNTDELIRVALQQRLEVQAIKNLVKSNSLQYVLTQLRDKPVINVNVLAGVKNGYIPDLNKPTLNFVLAVAANIPIFDGYLTRQLLAEVSANGKILTDRARETEELIRSDVLQAVADAKTSESALHLVEIQIKQSKKALEFARVRYAAGTVTNLDLIDALEACSMTQFQKLQALFKCVSSILNLRRAIGEAII
jgi:outer membrane protein